MININKTEHKKKIEVIVTPTAVFLIRAIQAILVSITHIGVVDAAVVRTQEVGRRACSDG